MVAAMRSRRVGNTLNRVPSATLAASATCRVVTSGPWSRISWRVAAISDARRSAGGRGRARVITTHQCMSEYSLIQDEAGRDRWRGRCAACRQAMARR